LLLAGSARPTALDSALVKSSATACLICNPPLPVPHKCEDTVGTRAI
jgi:hypothetical protein